MSNVSLIDGHIDEPKKAVVKCLKENCEYFNEYGECSSVCINNGFKKIITNYDRIRNMSVEEMAEILSVHDDCEKYCAYTKDGQCNKFQGDGKGGCADGIKQWLESEVTE